MSDHTLKVGDVLQIAPHDDVYGECFIVVTEVKGWGVEGYVLVPGIGRAYYGAKWEDVEYIGPAAFVAARHTEEEG